MPALYNPHAAKKPTNLSINNELLTKARELDINLSATLEQTLETLVRHRLGERWLAENRAAIAAYNEQVDAQGVFSDGVRSF